MAAALVLLIGAAAAVGIPRVFGFPPESTLALGCWTCAALLVVAAVYVAPV